MTIPVASLKSIRILIIDDDEEDFLIIKQYVSRIKGVNTFILEWCGNYSEGVAAVCRGEHDMYFVDFRLGEKTGLDLIAEAMANNCEEPIVLLTGAGNQDIDFQAMQAGASDYLVKSELNTEKLERCIRYGITRHQYLSALKENEQRYRGIFERTKDFIFIADENLFFLEVNKVGVVLFGFAPAEFSALSLPGLLANQNDRETIVEAMEQFGELNDLEIELRAKSGAVISCMLSLSKEKNALGHYYIQGIIHDITALKNAEIANLQTTKLKATERLVRTLAHEVRNPLNNIILAVDELDSPVDKHKVYLEIVTRNCNRINNIITELLYASKPAVIELQETPLVNVLSKSIAAASDRLTLKKVNLLEQYHFPHAQILADPEKLSIAFLNIIINAIEACQPALGQITIELTSDRGNHVVSISDNGHGIEEEHLGQLFEPYFTSKSAGMGLGLSAALSIFESHRALVKVKSAPGAGTTFQIIFKP